MDQPVILLADNDLGERDFEVRLLEEHIPTASVVVADCRSEADVLAEVTDHQPHAIVTQWAPISAAVLDKLDRCQVISRVGIGLDMIDLEAADRRGIPVVNVPHYCTEEVATHAVAMALALWRRLPQLDSAVRSGEWNAAGTAPIIRRLSKSTVGLVGLGRIGTIVAGAFASFGARVIVHDPVQGDDAYERVPVETLARESDIISLHAPLTASTRHLVDGDFLVGCQRAPIIVNTSRGGLIDLDALVEGLESGKVAGAGLDVFEEEPLDISHPILGQANTILTPHAAWCSREALPELRRESILNVIRMLTDFPRVRR